MAELELADKFGDAISNLATKRTSDLDLLIFDFDGSANKLVDIGTAEDVYYFLADFPLKGSADDLGKLKQAITGNPYFQLALAAHRQLRQPKRKATVRYRVVAQAPDAKWRQYRRVDMQRAVERGLNTLNGCCLLTMPTLSFGFNRLINACWLVSV